MTSYLVLLSMDLGKFKKYFIFYLLIGQISFYPCKSSKCARYLGWFIQFIYSLVIIICSSTLLRHSLQEFKETFNFYGFLASTILIPSVASAISNIFSPDGIKHIINSIMCVLKEVETKFKSLNSFDIQLHFIRAYNRKIIIIFLNCSVYGLFRALFLPSYLSRNLNVSITLLYFYKDCIILHFIFYVELLTSILKLLSIRLANLSKSKKLNQHQIIVILMKITSIHSCIWNIIKMVNNHFGWTLIMILSEALIDSVRMIYWIFWYFSEFVIHN